MTNSTYFFPSPIGGTPLAYDFAPSIIFAVIYAALLPMTAFRLGYKKSRTLVLLGSLFFALERIVDFSLRCDEARVPSRRTTKEFVIYLQTAYATGFAGIAKDLVIILRAYLVETTRGASTVESRSLDNLGKSREGGPESLEYLAPPECSRPDEPERRMLIRRACFFMALTGWASVIVGSISGGFYWSAITNASRAQLMQQTRYAGAVLTLVQLLFVYAASAWACYTRPKRVRRAPLLFLCAVAILVTVPTIYRLAVIQNETTSILSTAPGSLNTPVAKAVFYGLHIAPEWLATVMLLGVNVREMFHTGIGGDRSLSDDGHSPIVELGKRAWNRWRRWL